VPYIVGVSTALELAVAELPASTTRIRRLRDAFVEGVLERVQGAQLTGHPTLRLPNNASFVFEGLEGEALLLSLDQQDICASTGSACTSGSLEASHVLKAMGLPVSVAQGSLRFSFGKQNDAAQVEAVIDALVGIVDRLRVVAPVR
jgi:cysteine desulfurase